MSKANIIAAMLGHSNMGLAKDKEFVRAVKSLKAQLHKRGSVELEDAVDSLSGRYYEFEGQEDIHHGEARSWLEQVANEADGAEAFPDFYQLFDEA